MLEIVACQLDDPWLVIDDEDGSTHDWLLTVLTGCIVPTRMRPPGPTGRARGVGTRPRRACRSEARCLRLECRSGRVPVCLAVPVVEGLLEPTAVVVVAPLAVATRSAGSAGAAPVAWAAPPTAAPAATPPEDGAQQADDQEDDEQGAEEPEDREPVAPTRAVPVAIPVGIGRSDRRDDRAVRGVGGRRGDRGRQPRLVGRLGDEPTADDDRRDDEESDEEIAHVCVSSFLCRMLAPECGVEMEPVGRAWFVAESSGDAHFPAPGEPFLGDDYGPHRGGGWLSSVLMRPKVISRQGSRWRRPETCITR